PVLPSVPLLGRRSLASYADAGSDLLRRGSISEVSSQVYTPRPTRGLGASAFWSHTKSAL
ncbi:MAG: hypothetical protein SVX43_17405, partial [Cyanobacteriota bacterium]|nr:hypothetical protein [Cyanobacteriota bacterium]